MRYIALILLLSSLLSGQNISSSLSGTVHDPQGNSVPNVRISLTSEDRGFVRTTTTNDEGFFAFPDLMPATYTLVGVSPSFKTFRQTGITIESSERRSLGVISLQLGVVTESVTVSAEAVTVNAISGEASSTLNSETLSNIPVRGRDIFDAVALVPGVVDTTDGRDAPSATSARGIYIAGGRNESKNITIDGVYSLDAGSNDAPHTMPSMDSVAEVKVLTSAYAAEYGRNAGGAVTIITKGGGKDFHGSANWYYRHETLNANDWVNNAAGTQRALYRYNIAGYTIGGPVVLPKLKGLRDKVFFFWSQEFQRQMVAWGTKKITVPTAAERQGDFSNSLDVNGKLISVLDPLNSRIQFPGNIIPASRMSEVGQNVLGMMPLPNYRDPNSSTVNQWNYISSESGGYPRRTDTLRVDFQPHEKWQMYARLSNTQDTRYIAYGLWQAGSLNYKITDIVTKVPGRGATLHANTTISPTVFNEMILGYSRNEVMFTPDDPTKLDRTALGISIPQRNSSLNPMNLIPDMTFGGIANAVNLTLSNPTPYYNRNPIYSVLDNVAKIWKTHTFKFGFYFERTQKIAPGGALTRGAVSFAKDSYNQQYDANNAFANALLGNYDTYGESTSNPQANVLFRNTEWYLQDTWLVNRRLSLVYGVRFYSDSPAYEKTGQLSSFRPDLWDADNAPHLLRPGYDANKKLVAVDPKTGTTYSYGLVGCYAPGYGDATNGIFTGGKDGYPKGLYEAPAVSVAPRFGFSFDPFGGGRAAIRGGIGVFYDRLLINPSLNNINNPPSTVTPTVYYGTLAGLQEQISSGLLAPPSNMYSLYGTPKVPVVYNYNFSFQKALGRSAVAEVSYVGSFGRHLMWYRNINAVPLGSTFLAIHPENRNVTTTSTALSANFLRPYQGYGDIKAFEFKGKSYYNSLEASFRKALSHGISGSVSYTFSKNLDTGDSYASQVDPFYDPYMWNYGPSNIDRTHSFSAHYNWDLPKPGKRLGFRPAQWILDNWHLSGVTRMISGAPFTPTMTLVTSVNYAGSPSATVRPCIGDPDAPILERFVPPSFSAPNVPTLGNIGKGILRGPGVNNWDISIHRRLRLTEKLSGNLRVEAYNAFNHTQFSAVGTSLKFDSAGNQINSLFMQPTTSRPPRRIQLSLKLNW